ncbi:MAG TPA: hypothetical protein VMV17_16510, partial [Streptosporangiaceae bacterium]|nr:hypothetical protein [Streptosporangiaceae bacterium]
GSLVNNGEIYSFSLPAGCTNGCGPAYTPISYTSSGGGSSPSPSPSASPTGSTPPAGGQGDPQSRFPISGAVCLM